MSANAREFLRTQREWLKAALQPAMLLYLLVIPVLWAALTAILVVEQNRTFDGAVQPGGNSDRWVDHSACISGQSGAGKTLLGDTVLANFADREWFVRQRYAKVDKLDIAEPAVGRLSGKWIIFCRGGCAMPTAALPAWSPRRSTRSSSAAFTRRSTSAHGTVVLRNLDGVILASGGTSTPATGRQ